MHLRGPGPRSRTAPVPEGWAAQRSAAAAEHLSRLAAKQEAAHREAEGLLERFAAAACARGLPTEPLRVQGYRPGRSARTRLTGWYLRNDRKAGLDTRGRFYLLSVPLTWWDRIRGYTPAHRHPPLVLGSGGRDGDSLPLEVALQRLLPGWENVTR